MDTDHFHGCALSLLCILNTLPGHDSDPELVFARICIESLFADTKPTKERLAAQLKAVQYSRLHLNRHWTRLLINSFWSHDEGLVDEMYVDNILWNLRFAIIAPKRRAAFGPYLDDGQAKPATKNNTNEPNGSADYDPHKPSVGIPKNRKPSVGMSKATAKQPHPWNTLDDMIESMLRGDPAPDPCYVKVSATKGSISTLAEVCEFFDWPMPGSQVEGEGTVDQDGDGEAVSG